jgi:cell division protein FtsI/penicillin-binding protein 2
MGHEVAVTALQMVNAMSAIANDGFLMRPQVISRVTDARGRVLYEAEPEVLSRPVGRDTARIMRTLLEGAVREGGTGRRAAIEGYRVAGKTGTAQKPIPGGYSDSLNIASFTGFFPVEDPEVSMIIVVDEPLPQRTGGAVTAPVFAEIGQELVRYLATRPGEWSGIGRMAVQRKADADEAVFAFVDNL